MKPPFAHRVALDNLTVEAILAGRCADVRVAARPQGRKRLRAGDLLWVAEPFLHLTVRRKPLLQGLCYGGVPSHTPWPEHLRSQDCKVAVRGAADMQRSQSRLLLKVEGARVEAGEIVIAVSIAAADEMPKPRGNAYLERMKAEDEAARRAAAAAEMEAQP